MVSAEQKQQQQQKQDTSTAKSPKQSDAPLTTPKAENFIKPDQMSRPAEDVMRLRALLNTKETRETNTKQGQPSTQAQKEAKLQQQGGAPRGGVKHGHQHHHAGTSEIYGHEQRDRIAFRLVGSPTTNTNQRLAVNTKAKDPWSRAPGLPGEEQTQGLGDKQRQAMEGPNVSTATGQGHTDATSKFGPEQKTAEQSTAPTGGLTSSATQADRSIGAQLETVKLLDLVGPEAVMTLKERLREVWVNLDNTAATDLDVVARMPASVHGLNNSELLTVESPQGVHFVAFLKNRNDFEVLQTFDRHALLPGDPSKQLLEAAVMAYEQLGTVCREGAERIESRVKKVGGSQPSDQVIFDGLRKQWVVAKRRGKKCSDLVEDLIEKIDELELLEKEIEKAAEGASGKPAADAGQERIIKPENERPILEVGDDE